MACDVDTWPRELDELLAETDGPLRRVFVVRETDSTQDAARRMGLVPGEALIARQQTAGRGRLGRSWADGAHQGVALTAVVKRAAPERLAIAAAVAAALAAESLLGRRVGVKWPNDILIDGRKLAGILTEQTIDRAYIGIGLNVFQREWPEPLNGIAISMAEAGADVTRLDVVAALLVELNHALRRSDDQLTATFAERDVLRGTPACFRSGGAVVSGVVRRIDPMKGLTVLTENGEMWLPAATTSVVKQ